MIDRCALTLALALFALPWAAQAAWSDGDQKLPESVPLPQVHAEPAGNIPPERIGDTPVPEARPAREDAAEPAAQTPAVAPAPQPAPDDAVDPPEAPATQAAPAEPDPRSGSRPSTLMPHAEIVCRQALRDLGARFKDRPAEGSEDGCALPYPVELSSLGDDVELAPPAVVNCATAEAAARFTRAEIGPAAQRLLGSRLTGIDQASGYVCRPRNGTTKLSEHAFGNALDIAGFRLADGRSVAVAAKDGGAEAGFLDAVRKAACGPFKTVLGPGSDADHATHLHLDLAPRRGGAEFCQ